MDFFDFFRFREESSIDEVEWSSSSTTFPFFRFLDLDLDSDEGSASAPAFIVSSFAGSRFCSFSDLSAAPGLGVGSMAEGGGLEASVDDLFFLRLFFSFTSDATIVVPATLASATSGDGSVARSEITSEAFSFFRFFFSFLSPDRGPSSSLPRFRFRFSFSSGLEGTGSGSTGVPGSTVFFFFVRAPLTISGRVSAWSEASAILSCFFVFSLRSNR